MAIQLCLFNVDEFLLKSSHEFFLAMDFVKFVNRKLRRLTGSAHDNFFNKTLEQSKKSVKVALDGLMIAPRFCTTYLGRVLLISENT
jgi:hypothetical protein